MTSTKRSMSMSGSGLRSFLFGLLVYFTGSPRAERWREAMIGLAQECGWQVAEDDGSADLVERLGADQPMLVLSSLIGPSHIAGCGLQVAVVKDTPSASVQALAADQSRAALNAAVYHSSAMFAFAADLAKQGAIVLDANASSLRLPLLGEVAAAPGAGVSTEAWHSLDIYKSLPPSVGAEADWPLSVFNYPIMTSEGLFDTGKPLIDLTGRARTIVYGPYTFLTSGLWEVEVKMMIDPDGGRSHLRFEWGSNPDYVGSTATVSRSGVYSIRLQRYWPTIGHSEMRVKAIQPHFHGRFELLSVNVRLLSEALPVEPVELD